LKRHLSSLLGALRQRIVLTPEEKRVLGFVLAAFFLGVTVKHYRDTDRETLLPANANHISARSDHAAASPLPTKAQKRQRKKTPSAIPPARAN
jgi:hypothetical protein